MAVVPIEPALFWIPVTAVWCCKPRAQHSCSNCQQKWQVLRAREGLQRQPRLFGLPAGRKQSDSLSRQHTKPLPTNLTYFLGRERKILSRGKATVTPLCALGAEVLCALHLFTCLYQQRRMPENWVKYLLFSVRSVNCMNKVTWPEPYRSVWSQSGQMGGGNYLHSLSFALET